MNTHKEFQLVNGTFTPDQARQVLGAMVKSKIDFHTLEGHSEAERSGTANHSNERLSQLRNLDVDLKELFETAKQNGANLKVSGSFRITIID